MRIADMAGKTVGHLTVLRLSHTFKTRAFWICKCVCGTEKAVLGKHLRSGQVTSCGCKRGSQKTYEDYSIRRAELKAKNPSMAREHTKAYRERNRSDVLVRGRIYSSQQRAKRKGMNSTPTWAEKEKIDLVYQKARLLGMTVDHIVPLVSKLVCGLHVWANLQLMTSDLNKTKGNRFWPHMPDTRLSNTTLQALSQ